MTILVDYDNVEKALTRLGIVHVVNSIVTLISPIEIGTGTRIMVRLYGGWYENNRFTNRAQDISVDIAKHFPMPCYLSDKATQMVVSCEMAYSLLADPGNHLFHTFRPRGVPEGLKAEHPALCGCRLRHCPIIETFKFVSNGKCSQCGTISPKDIFYRGEQKLVDTMLTSDLVFSSNPSTSLCIVSSDDDFWPGIATSLKTGGGIIHIHTKPGMKTPPMYSKSAGTAYRERNL